jgi:hypothetical protein
MKYIGFWKVVGGDAMDVIEKFRKMTAEREKGNENFAKLIFSKNSRRSLARAASYRQTPSSHTSSSMGQCARF